MSKKIHLIMVHWADGTWREIRMLKWPTMAELQFAVMCKLEDVDGMHREQASKLASSFVRVDVALPVEE